MAAYARIFLESAVDRVPRVPVIDSDRFMPRWAVTLLAMSAFFTLVSSVYLAIGTSSVAAKEPSLSDVVSLARESVVRITALGKSDRPEENASTFGTGFVISDNGEIVTNYHIIKSAREVRVTLVDHRDFVATLIGLDTVADIALLKIDASNLAPLPFGDSSAARAGDDVLTIGTPYRFFTGTVTRGIISATHRVTTAPLYLLQTDLRINIGNSGGPLLDAHGEVIGVIVQSFGPTQTSNTGINFAIPANAVVDALDYLRRGQAKSYPLLGADLNAVTYRVAEATGYRGVMPDSYQPTTGAYVKSLHPETPGSASNLRPGDIVTHANDTPIWVYTDLVRAVGQSKLGETLMLTVFRNGNRQTIPVTLDLAR